MYFYSKNINGESVSKSNVFKKILKDQMKKSMQYLHGGQEVKASLEMVKKICQIQNKK